MLNVCRLLLLSILTMLFVAGCCCGTLQGTWLLCENQPYLEKQDAKIVKLSFYQNGSYAEVSSKNDKTTKSKGMYDYNPCSKDLVLMSGDKARCYRVRSLTDRKMCLDMCGPKNCMVTTAVLVRSCKCPYRPSCAPCDPCPSPCCPPACPTCP
ncbi:MAG: hypothetical protein JSV03_01170 [Planctomycetota bacterium]|nr:MAG: hypothetical protein JSV03_01170 [Planctomycetota bacterium]